MTKHKWILAILLCAVPFAAANAGQMEGKVPCECGDFADVLAKVRPLAEQGNAEAQLKLGSMYMFGNGVKKDEVEANKWIRKSADQGNLKAQYFLGLNYSLGSGVIENQVEAAAWYRKAADRGYVHAQFEMGSRYELGRGVKKDQAEAIRWYRLAAKQGYVAAQIILQSRGLPSEASAPLPSGNK